jgi:outer membrane scaffolding protein for murein synthesis (MipA/OmpV family)
MTAAPGRTGCGFLWRHRLRLAWRAGLLLGLAAAPAAQADQPLWELGLGAGALRLPHYRGSDQSHDWLLPVPYAVYRGKIFRADREGARALLFDSERLDVDLSAAASAPTRSQANRARSGMPDLAGTLELGPNLNLALAKGAGWKFDLRVPVHAVFTLQSRPQAIGWTLSPVLNLDLQLQGWKLGLQGGPQAASRRYHGYFYDVAPAYATAERPAYGAHAGAAGWHLTAAASRRVGDWWLGGFVRADSLAGAAFDASPLVKRRDNVSVGLAFSRVFMVSDQRVDDDR